MSLWFDICHTFLVLWKVDIEPGTRSQNIEMHSAKIQHLSVSNKNFLNGFQRVKSNLERQLYKFIILWKLFYNFIIDYFSNKLNSTITLMRQIWKRNRNIHFTHLPIVILLSTLWSIHPVTQTPWKPWPQTFFKLFSLLFLVDGEGWLEKKGNFGKAYGYSSSADVSSSTLLIFHVFLYEIFALLNFSKESKAGFILAMDKVIKFSSYAIS